MRANEEGGLIMQRSTGQGAGAMFTLLVCLVFATAVAAAGKPPDVSAGGTMGEFLAKLDEISAKLDKVENASGARSTSTSPERARTIRRARR
jgi:hypothetical protein